MGASIFVSHSHSDRNAARTLVEALLADLKVDADQIRCTSVPGHQTPFGFTIAEELKKDLKSSRAVITLITSSGLASRWLVFELGASWALGKVIIIVLAPGVTSDRLPGPLDQLPCVSVDSSDALAQLDTALDQIAEALQLRRRQNDRSRRLTKLRDFVEAFRCATEEPSDVGADTPDADSDGNMLERSDSLVRWLPPPRTGLVYVVISRRGPGSIEVGVKWGSWQKREPVALPPDHTGMVLRIEHNAPDSWPLTVDTSGIVENGPTQRRAPPEWNSPSHLKVV